jgi:signal transduction histidine kinase
MDSAAQRRRWPVFVTAGSLCLMILALRSAVASYGMPVAGVLVTPDAVVSDLGLPNWSGIRQGLRFPDRITEVDGQELTGSVERKYRAVAFDHAVTDAFQHGRPSVRVKVKTADGTRQLDLEVQRLGPLAWWTYAGVMFLGGGLYVGAALIAIWAGQSALARTFAKLAIFASLLLFSFFDFHSTRQLVPFFELAQPMIPMALLSLGLRLPDDVPLVARSRWFIRALDGVGLVVAVSLIWAHSRGNVTGSLSVIATMLYPVGMVSLAIIVAFRFIRARGQRREVLRPLMFTLALPHLMIAVGFLMHGPIKTLIDMIAFPMLSLTPLATMVAFVRHDIWRSRSFLPRFLTRAIIAIMVCVVGIVLGTAFGVSLGTPFGGALVASSMAAVAAALLVVLALRIGDKAFFPSLADYKPTVEQLSEELASIASPGDVALAIERTVRRWLPCDAIELALASIPEFDREPLLVTDPSDLASPPIQTDVSGLTLPVVFHGARLGTLLVSEKRGGALFTSEDLDLLKTIANQGALALAHAIAYAELERRRKQQAAAWRDEREALVETLSAEIAHEIRYPINFFRSIFQRATASKVLDEEDLEIGNEEVDRLERLVSGLRRLATQHLERGSSNVSELCDRAEVLLRDRMGDHSLHVDVGDGGAIRCDVDKVTQVLVNLLANALDATEGKGEVGISWRSGPRGGELSVWDTGPGFEGDPSRLFAPWYTTKERGTGLGLAITYRLVRAHGWTVEAMRKSGKTIFVVSVPPGDIVSASDRVKMAGIVPNESVQANVSGSSEGVA